MPRRSDSVDFARIVSIFVQLVGPFAAASAAYLVPAGLQPSFFGKNSNPLLALIGALFVAGIVSAILSLMFAISSHEASRRTSLFVLMAVLVYALVVTGWWLRGASGSGSVDIFTVGVFLATSLSVLGGFVDHDDGFWRLKAKVSEIPVLICLLAVLLLRLFFFETSGPGYSAGLADAFPKPENFPSRQDWAAIRASICQAQRVVFWDGFSTGASAILLLASQIASFQLDGSARPEADYGDPD